MSHDTPWKLRKGRIEFILVAVSEDNAESLIAEVFDLTQKHDAEVDLVSSVAVITYGTDGTEAFPKGKRFPLIEVLRQKVGYRVKILHGAGIGHCGFVGGASGGRFNYIIPGLKEACRQIEDVAFGEIKEFFQESGT